MRQWPDGVSASGGNSQQNSRQWIHIARLFASRQTPVFAELRRSDDGRSEKPDPLFWFVPSFCARGVLDQSKTLNSYLAKRARLT
jgi:hypothetical protein